MNRLNLDTFRAQVTETQIKELQSLTGGILGACHCGPDNHPPSESGPDCLHEFNWLERLLDTRL